MPDYKKIILLHYKGFSNRNIYEEMANHYGTIAMPARPYSPRDKASVEDNVGNITIWIIAALRNQKFFSRHELNLEIRNKLLEFNQKPFQKRYGRRESVFFDEEKPLLLPLPQIILK